MAGLFGASIVLLIAKRWRRKTVKGLLGVPRELFLAICADLSPHDLAQLSAASKDCYLATQAALYKKITIKEYDALLELTRTLMKPPVVSYLKQKQRKRFRSSPEPALCERVIDHLDVIIETPAKRKDRYKCDLHHISQLLSVVSRQSPQVDIVLRLEVSGFNSVPISKLASLPFSFPRVTRVILTARCHLLRVYRSDYWSVFLGGRLFPDLEHLETNCFLLCPRRHTHDLPLAPILQYQTAVKISETLSTLPGNLRKTTLGRLPQLKSLEIKGDFMLNQPVLHSLFAPRNSPSNLTTLAISHCPELLHTVNLPTLAKFLRRALTDLPALHSLKLHMIDEVRSTQRRQLREDYTAALLQNPQHHLCNIIRTLGQKIKSLDLGLTFACNRIFLPPNSDPYAPPRRKLGPPLIPRKPLETLPKRLLKKGFRYRRLIAWDRVCSSQHAWADMTSLAGAQGPEVSWEIIGFQALGGSWHVGDHDAVHFKADDVLFHGC